MASTAEAVRDKDEAPKAEIPPMLARPEEPKAPTEDAPLKTFGQIASSLDVTTGLRRMAEATMPSREEVTTAREVATAAGERAARNASERAAAYDAEVDVTKKEAHSLADAARANRPQAPQLQAPPSRGLRPFLASSPNEPPEASITKLITGLSTFAQMIGGGRAGARGALSAMTGALEGWKAGDKERADRHFADWKAQTDTMLKQWDVELEGYESWLRAEGMPLEQRILGLRLQAEQNGNHALADKLSADNAHAVFKELGDRQKVALDYTRAAAEIDGRKQEADRRHDERTAQQQMLFQHWQDLRKDKQEARDKAASDLKEQVDGYSQESLAALGQQWALDPSGRMPIGAPRGKVGEMIRPKIVQAGMDWLKTQGIDPMTLPSVRAEIGAAKAALTKLTVENARQMASIRRFDGHTDALLKLSSQVPRSEMPAVNQAILNGERDYQGSPIAAAYVVQAFEVGMELSKVVVGAGAQGDAGTREEARKAIGVALNHEQLTAVVTQLRQNAHRNIETNRESQKEQLDVITRAGGGAGVPGKEPPKAPAATAATTQPAIPKGAHREGDLIVSDDGQYVWKDKKWQKK